MKNLLEIAWRLIKVIYVLLLISGVFFGIVVWLSSAPYSYKSYTYEVKCDNGKSFDPTSKPIDQFSYVEPYTFDDLQIKSECEYGTAYYVGLSRNLSKNYELTYKEHKQIVRTKDSQITNTIVALILYYILLELIRRTFLYIFFGKTFITLKKK